jgi:hypothetical protein
VLQKAELSDEADSENYLEGFSETICITSDWAHKRTITSEFASNATTFVYLLGFFLHAVRAYRTATRL